MTATSCNGPPSDLEYREHPYTYVVSAELPLDKTMMEAELCSEERKTQLSECPSSAERSVGKVIREVGPRTFSAPWKLELVRGVREEQEGVLAKIGVSEFGEGGSAETESTKCYPREEIGGVPGVMARFTAVPQGCFEVDVMVPQVPVEWPFYGTQELWLQNGIGNGLHPSRLQFRRPGALFASEEKPEAAEQTGELRLFGSEAVQLISAR
jgi:hypothetical protein